MSTRAVCPHCHHELLITVATPEPEKLAPLEVKPTAATSKTAACGCGHERGKHEAETGRCLHGAGTVTGGCTCPGYHSRRRGPATANHTNGVALQPLSRCAHAVLQVVVQRALKDRATPTTREQVAILAGYSVDSGSFASALAELRRRDLVHNTPDGMVATDDGVRAVGPLQPLPVGWALLDYWVARVGPCAGAILTHLATTYPKTADRVELANVTGYSPSSGSFASALAKLRTLALIDGLRASDELMSSLR